MASTIVINLLRIFLSELAIITIPLTVRMSFSCGLNFSITFIGEQNCQTLNKIIFKSFLQVDLTT